MKKWLFVLVFAFSSAFAADLNVFNESSKAWLAAINAATDLGFDTPANLPGYGIAFSTSKYKKFSEAWTENYATIKGLTAALQTTLKGLEPTDYLSLSITYTGDFGAPDTQVTARIKGADLAKGTWEVWVNGKKQ
jgi:hypothetical protein